MKDAIKNTIRGTRLEPIARKVWRSGRRLAGGRIGGGPQGSILNEDVLRNREYDRLTVEVMRRALSPTSNCIDVGAHRGSILRHIVDVAPQGSHYAFEPLPEFARRLTKEFPSVDVLAIALADWTGTTPFRHVLGAPAYSGFQRRPWDTYEERVELIDVRVERLDDLLSPDYSVDFIKVDVEGSEAAVFRGALDTLRRERPVVAFELGLDASETFDVLVGQAGFHVSRLSHWLAGRPPYATKDDFVEDAGEENYFFLAHP